MDAITTDQAAELLGLSRDGVLKLIRRGTLPSRYVGPAGRGLWLIDLESINAEIVRRSAFVQNGKGRPPKHSAVR